MEKRLDLQEFFFLVENGELDRLAILSYVEMVTEKYKGERLKIFLEEIDFYIFNRKEELYDSNQDKIEELKNQYRQEGKELPYKELNFNFVTGPETYRILDKDKLLGGAITWQLYSLYELIKFVKSRLQDEQNSNKILIKTKEAPKVQKLSFSNYLTKEGQKLLPTLLEFYSSVRFKKEYAIMLLVLKDLGYLVDNAFANQESLHLNLEATFPAIGTRQNLVNYLQQYNNPNTTEETELERHKQRLLQAIKLKD